MNQLLAITGATGRKSGGAFVDVLCENKEEVMTRYAGGVRAIARPTSNTSKLEGKAIPFEVLKGNFDSKEFLETALTGVSTLVHTAGINLSPMLVDAAVMSGVKRMILVHTTGIYSKYKKAGEEYRKIDAYVEQQCRENNIGLTILRPTMIYGNISDHNVVQFVKMVDRLPLMPVVNGARYELQPVHYADLSKAYYQVLMNDHTANHNYTLSGGKPILLRDMLSEIGNCLGKKVHFVSCPFPIAYAGACVLYWVTFKKKDYREKVQRLCEPRVYSYDEAKTDFGYDPRTFDVGIVDEVKEYMMSQSNR